MGKVIGKVIATEKNPSTIDDFYFWTKQDLILNPFDVVKINHLQHSISYGVIEEISHITDTANFLADYVSNDFGDVDAVENTHRIGMNYVTIQAVLNSTKGKVGKGKEFFEKAFGSNEAEFNKLLLMPEAMIVYRFYFEKIGLTDEWWQHYSALTNEQKEIVNPIIYSNVFDHYEETVTDEKCLKVLSYYRIRREDAESVLREES